MRIVEKDQVAKAVEAVLGEARGIGEPTHTAYLMAGARVRYHRGMSNHHDAQAADEIIPIARRVTGALKHFATALRQFWQGYLLSPTGC